LEHSKVTMIWDSVLDEVLGSENPSSVTGVRVKNVKTNEMRELKVDGVFIAIGHKPATDVFQGVIDTDEEGYIKCSPGSVKTNIPGVFAAGDVQDKVYRQAVTAAGQGCMAALDVDKFLAGH
jgi:thioredoxin reductase (NADPH)